MAMFIAFPALIYFFFFLDLSIIVKGIAVAFCAFQWVSNRNAVLTAIENTSDDPTYENAHRNPTIVFFMSAGMLGTIVGLIAIAVDVFRLFTG
ncbi:MAG: hypothetical protein GY829_14645 [Gammaproteobacteria bacterium]|nr:hypothetical protein [Gammaproteobacteria bacterium]